MYISVAILAVYMVGIMVASVVETKMNNINVSAPPQESIDTEEIAEELKDSVKKEMKITAAELAQPQPGDEPDVDGTGVQDEYDAMPESVIYTEFPSYKDNAAVQGFSGCYDMIADQRSQTGFTVTEIPTPSEIIPRGYKRPTKAKLNSGLVQPRAIVEPRPGVTPLVDTPKSKMINTGSDQDTNIVGPRTVVTTPIVQTVTETPKTKTDNVASIGNIGQGIADIAKGIAVL